MAKITFPGLEKYIEELKSLEQESDDIIKQAVYAGAEIMADGIKSAIQSLPTGSKKFYAHDGTLLKGVTPAQKQGLIDGFGISKMENKAGYVNVKIGFNGYNSEATPKFPQGQPNALIARSVESGTSVRAKTPFVRPAVAQNKAAAEAAMKKKFDELVAKKIKK